MIRKHRLLHNDHDVHLRQPTGISDVKSKFIGRVHRCYRKCSKMLVSSSNRAIIPSNTQNPKLSERAMSESGTHTHTLSNLAHTYPERLTLVSFCTGPPWELNPQPWHCK